MSIARDQYDRRLLPRWRASSDLGEAQELLPIRPAKQIALSEDGRHLRESRYQFEITPTIGHALDLFSAAIVTKSAEADIHRAAQHLLSHANELAPSLKNLVQRYAGGRPSEATAEPQHDRVIVANSRRLLRINPRNPLVWADLARHYAATGNKKRAIQNMQVALALAPDHRWIIRAAVRCFVHCEESVYAHRILSQHPRTKQDPWLIAAELATAQDANRPPHFWRQANQMLQWGNLRPEHLSELSTAVAMYDLESSGARRARKHLAKGLDLPTENALAQIAWAVQQKHLTGMTSIDELVESNRNAHEAEFHRRAAAGDYLRALDACKRWSDDEPFAGRPFTGLAFLSSILDDYENTIHYANRAQTLDGKLDITTRLNRIYAELSLGVATQSNMLEWFRDELYSLMKENESTHLLANLGLWYYRAGLPERGREFYEKSIALSVKKGQLEQASMASAFCCREAILQNETDAGEFLAKTDQLATRARNVAAAFYVRKLKALISAPEKAKYILSPESAAEFIAPDAQVGTPRQTIKLVHGVHGPIALVSKSKPRLKI